MSGSDRLISPEDVRHVARLARLALDEDEVRRLDTADVPPTAHPFPVENVLRPDVEVPCLDREWVLAQAPVVENNRFQVPRIMGEAP